jgi:hypothetical protein
VDQAPADHGNKHAWNEQEKVDLVTGPCFNFTTISTYRLLASPVLADLETRSPESRHSAGRAKFI